MDARILSYLRPRGRLLGFALALGVMAAAVWSVPEAATEAGLTEFLEKELDETVVSFAWEPRRSPTRELVLGRPLLLVTRSSSGGAQKLHRVFVRLSPEGGIVDLGRRFELASTAPEERITLDVDEALALAAVAVEGTEGARRITFFDLTGERNAPSVSALDVPLLGLLRLLATGDTRGLGRTELVLEEGAGPVELRSGRGHVTVHTRSASRELPRAVVAGDRPFGAPASPIVELDVRRAAPVDFRHLAADALRSWLGARAVARAEELYLTAQDSFRRFSHGASGVPRAETGPLGPTASPPSPKNGVKAPVEFPPPPVDSFLGSPEPGEGKWRPAGGPLVDAARTGGLAPVFARTFVRADPDRPYVRTELVAMDMRHLELGIVAGYEDPAPTRGAPGTGHVPSDPAVFRRIVATFNGAFKTLHGSYGMKENDRVIVPPVEGAATVRVDPDGRAGFGTYRSAERRTDLPLERAVAFRQNLEPLLEGGKLLPSGRTSWGDQLVGQSVAAERSGLCRTEAGHLIYVWSTEATATSLARAMALGGCTFGMHLDMNPGHCAFSFNRIEAFEPLRAQGEVLDPRMKVSATRYVRWSPKDFFYVALRGGAHQAAPGLDFQRAPGLGPEPTSLPAVMLAKERIADLELEFESVDMDRFVFSASVGSREPTSGVSNSLSVADTPIGDNQVLVTFSLGHATAASRTGLALGSSLLVPMDRSYATLVLPTDRSPFLLPPGESREPSPNETLVQLPVLARDGELDEGARRIGSLRTYGALCLDPRGNLLVGRMSHDTPLPLVRRMTSLGCELVASLDRGSSSSARVRRAGTDAPPISGEPETMLVLRARVRDPSTYHF